MAAHTSPSQGSVEKRILDLLFFRQISDRYESIATAHKRTLQWIFHDPFLEQKPWDNFKQWLEEGSGCYWINGKAGSGKPTLMKYSQQDDRTRQNLKSWGGSDVLTPAHFFYNLGTTLQKSYQGLLRSVLFDVLSRHTELVPICFPDVYRAVMKGELVDQAELTINELKKAFAILFGLGPNSLRICLFLDGIDEYEGDLSELLAILLKVESSETAKIVVSSRPTAECTSAFSRYKKLRLQDLTQNDIRSYVVDHFVRHSNLQDLQDSESELFQSLTDDIAKRASGVFLWVMLVVRSLLKGFDHYEDLSGLKRRLEELPTDLKKLYRHMFEKMELVHQQEGSKYLQIVLRSQDVQKEAPLRPQQFSFAVADSFELPEALMDSELPRTSRQLIVLKGRVSSRCCGLVEVVENMDAAREVTFLHKTVSEFLRDTEVWSSLLALTSNTTFDVNASLAYSCMRYILSRCNWAGDFFHNQSRTLSTIITYALKYASRVRLDSQRVTIQMMHKLEILLPEPHTGNTDGVGVMLSDVTAYVPPFQLVSDPRSSVWFLLWAAHERCNFYVDSRLHGEPLPLDANQKTLLLAQFAIKSLYDGDNDRNNRVRNLNTLERISQCSDANPNAAIDFDFNEFREGVRRTGRSTELFRALEGDYSQSFYTAWRLVLVFVDLLGQQPHRPGQSFNGTRNSRRLMCSQSSLSTYFVPVGPRTLFIVLKLLIERSADVNEICKVGKVSKSYITRSALTIILRLRDRLSRLCDEVHEASSGDSDLEPVLDGTERSYIEESFDKIITMMKERGAEEKGTYKNKPDAALFRPTPRRSQDTELVDPTPPYSLDIGPDKFYSTPVSTSTRSGPDVRSRSSGVRDRLRKPHRPSPYFKPTTSRHK